MTEYLQHLLQFDLKINYEPDLLQNMNIKYGTILPVELFLIPTWHASIPDELTIDNTTYTLDDLYYGGSNMVFGQGMDSIINAMTTTPAGEVSMYVWLHYNCSYVNYFSLQRIMLVKMKKIWSKKLLRMEEKFVYNRSIIIVANLV